MNICEPAQESDLESYTFVQEVSDQMLLMHQIGAKEKVAKIDMDLKNLLKKADPNSMQDIIKDVMLEGVQRVNRKRSKA